MRVLADTHALVWAINSPELLGPAALTLFENQEILASVATFWELCLKASKQNSLVTNPAHWWKRHVTDGGVSTLSIRAADVLTLCSLREIHKDPFDRILVAQALSENIPLITKDRQLALYGVPTIW